MECTDATGLLVSLLTMQFCSYATTDHRKFQLYISILCLYRVDACRDANNPLE